MKKDVIYIDIEDDITSIIEKIKGASSKIVALVPPKRTGALQSIVNLKLLQRAAAGVDKRVVIITADTALSALAAGVNIPVAKNLQSRPEVAPIAPAEGEDADVIDGEKLPVGDLARTSATSAAIADEKNSTINDAAKAAGAGLGVSAPVAGKGLKNDKKAKADGVTSKIPNFDTFRKKLFIFGGLGVFLIGFLVWALAFAPSATVTVTAKTSAVNISQPLTLNPGSETDIKEGRIKPEIKQIKKTISTEFDTTGTKVVGERAGGTMHLLNAMDGDPIDVPAGTIFMASNGLEFISDSGVTVPGASVSGGRIVPGEVSVAVTAVEIGADYNLAPQNYTPGVEGVTARGEEMTGGSKETVSIVAPADVDKARQELQEQDINEVRQELSKQFGGNVVLIKESFRSEKGQPNVAPNVGEKAKRARLSVETTYTMVALPRDQVDALLNDHLQAQIEEGESRRIYGNGSKTLRFSRFQQTQDGKYIVHLNTVGYIGPVINEDQLKQQITGKRYGEIEQLVTNIEGVENVEINFSPFWVTKAPSPEKIDIRFSVKNNVE